MNGLKIAFLMDPVENLKVLGDSSCAMMNAALDRGHQVYYVDYRDVYVQSQVVKCDFSGVELVLQPDGLIGEVVLVNQKKGNLKDFDVIINRVDPPFNMNYIYLTYVLDLVKEDVFVMNEPRGVRTVNEKFYALNFGDMIPDTLVARRKKDVLEFLQKHQELGCVMKPLDGKGGDGVLRLRADDVNKNELIKIATNGGQDFVMVQEFLPAIKEGDKRIVLLGGEILNAFLRLPGAGDFRGNLSAGASSVVAEVTEKEREMVERLKSFIEENGLYLVGLDVIGEKITEMNVTSPIIGFQHFPENAAKVIEFLEEKAC